MVRNEKFETDVNHLLSMAFMLVKDELKTHSNSKYLNNLDRHIETALIHLVRG